MKLVARFAFALFAAGAAAWAQSGQTFYSGRRGVSASGADVSVSAEFRGEIMGAAGSGDPAAFCYTTVLGDLNLDVLGGEARVATPYVYATSNGRAGMSLEVGNYSLSMNNSRIAVAGSVVQPIVFQAVTVFALLGFPVLVVADCGAGVDWWLMASGRVQPASVSLSGTVTQYALLRLHVTAFIGVTSAGAVGQGELLRARLESELSATAAGPEGYLRLSVAPRQQRVYVYALVHLPWLPPMEQRRYLINTTIPGAEYDLINIAP